MTPTQTQSWVSPHPMQPPAPQRRPPLAVIAALVGFALVIVALGAVLLMTQQNKLDGERDKTADLTVQRDKAEATVERRELALDDAAGEISDLNDTYENCDAAMDVSRHMARVAMASTSAGAADDVFEEGDQLDIAIKQSNKVKALLDASGYDDIWSLYDSCGTGSGAGA